MARRRALAISVSPSSIAAIASCAASKISVSVAPKLLSYSLLHSPAISPHPCSTPGALFHVPQKVW